MGSHLAIRLMGEFEIAFDGSPCRAVNTARLQSLTAFLITHRAAPQLRQTVSFLFWPDSSERQALNNLRTLFYHLRRALPNARSYIDADAVTVRWRSESEFSLDVAELEAALGAGAIGRRTE